MLSMMCMHEHQAYEELKIPFCLAKKGFRATIPHKLPKNKGKRKIGP